MEPRFFIHEIDDLASVMHDAYEARAVEVGWSTQEQCRVPYGELPEENKKVMRAGLIAVLKAYEANREEYMR